MALTSDQAGQVYLPPVALPRDEPVLLWRGLEELPRRRHVGAVARHVRASTAVRVKDNVDHRVQYRPRLQLLYFPSAHAPIIAVKRNLDILIFALALMLVWASVAKGQVKPAIVRAVDAQPVGEFDNVVAIGANTLHRYDNGPQHTTTLATWTAEARKRGLFYILQGTAIEAQADYDPTGDPYLLAIAQDDEPELNRWDSSKTPDQQAWLVPDGKMKGMTKPAILADRYARWKAKWPDVPVRVNFSGKDMTNPYYADGAQHLDYMRAADGYGIDWYAKTTNANQTIGMNGFALRKLATWADVIKKRGVIYDAYFECSDQHLNAVGRGPTPTEIHTTIWHLLANGVRGVSAFPQRIGQPFSYNNMTPDQRQAVVDAYATIARYENLIVNGTRTLSVNPAFAWNATKGTVTLPTLESATWTRGAETLNVTGDVTGATMPVFVYTPSPLPSPSTLPTTQPTPDPVVKLTADLATAQGQIVELKATVADLSTTINALRQVFSTTQPATRPAQ